MRREHMPFQYMKQFKAIALDYDYYLTLEDEGRLYCLTDRQIYLLMGQLDYIGWMTRWYNADDITQTTLGFIQSELMEKLMTCVDISILVDQGKLNLTRSVQQQQIQSQALRDAYEGEYTGDPTSINPDAPTANFGSTGDRYDALCAALMAFVYQFAKGQIEAIVAGDVAAFALMGLAAALLIPGLNLFFIAGAAIALIAGGGIIGVTTAVACEALGDAAALDAVVCYMRDTLKAQSVTEANWSACLDSYPFSVGSHEAIICDFIKPTLSNNYLTVLDMLGQAYNGTINGEPLPECPCEEPIDPCEDASLSFDFTTGEHDWYETVPDYAVYHPGEGWGRNSWHGRISIDTIVTGTINRVKVYFNGTIPGIDIRSAYVNGWTSQSGSPIVTTEGIYTAYDFVGLSFSNGVSAQGYDFGASIPEELRLVRVCIWLD